MVSTVRKIGWWMDSVRGLRMHLQVLVAMKKIRDRTPVEKRTAEETEQIRQQEGMIGHCLLHVLLIYPVGSGRMFD